jgi:hypothetical protein
MLGAAALRLPDIRESPTLTLAPEWRPLLAGLPRGAITEIVGGRSSGRATFVHSVLAEATRGGETCAVADTMNAFDPATAARAGVDLNKLIWVRANGRLDHAMKAADLLVHGGGFGVVVLDLCELSPRLLNGVPLSYWYRYRRAIENTPAILLVTSSQPNTRCAVVQIEMRQRGAIWRGRAPAPLLAGVEMEAIASKPRRHAQAIVAKNLG